MEARFHREFDQCCMLSPVYAFLQGTHRRAGHQCPLVNLPQPARSMIADLAKGVDIAALRSLAWRGVPESFRPIVFQLLVGYLPADASFATLRLRSRQFFGPCAHRQPSRDQYLATVRRLLGVGDQWPVVPSTILQPEPLLGGDTTLRCIRVDVPRFRRFHPAALSVEQSVAVDQMLERVLFVFACTHAAVGYRSGMCRLALCFLLANLQAAGAFSKQLSAAVLAHIEADAYGVFQRFVVSTAAFQDKTVQDMLGRLDGVLKRVDAPLARHFQHEQVTTLLFAHKWMHGLLLDEVGSTNSLRLLDILMGMEPSAVCKFVSHLGVALVLAQSAALQACRFPAIMTPLQRIAPDDFEHLAAHAYYLHASFAGASGAHTSVGSPVERPAVAAGAGSDRNHNDEPRPLPAFRFWG